MIVRPICHAPGHGNHARARRSPRRPAPAGARRPVRFPPRARAVRRGAAVAGAGSRVALRLPPEGAAPLCGRGLLPRHRRAARAGARRGRRGPRGRPPLPHERRRARPRADRRERRRRAPALLRRLAAGGPGHRRGAAPLPLAGAPGGGDEGGRGGDGAGERLARRAGPGPRTSTGRSSSGLTDHPVRPCIRSCSRLRAGRACGARDGVAATRPSAGRRRPAHRRSPPPPPHGDEGLPLEARGRP